MSNKFLFGREYYYKKDNLNFLPKGSDFLVRVFYLLYSFKNENIILSISCYLKIYLI